MSTVSDGVGTSSVHERAARRARLAGELRQALADKQLFVKYQPVVGLSPHEPGEGCVRRNAGVEALVRWNHRIRGAVSPLEFIEVAEECGLSTVLGDYVLRAACSQFVTWQNELHERAPCRVAVNLSKGQVEHPGFAASVADALQFCGMPAKHLQLEIHEGLAAQDPEIQARLCELKELGVTVALDNFGSGYSSLTRLHQLPVDVIKIDRSFVNQAVDSTHHRVLIEVTVRVAKSLRMRAAAEGIETEAQLAVVRELGCDAGQGYYFSEAVSAASLTEWLIEEI